MSAATYIAMYIHKGGTGKTNLCYNLSHSLAMQGKHVLVVDLDVQVSQLVCQLGAESYMRYYDAEGDSRRPSVHTLLLDGEGEKYVRVPEQLVAPAAWYTSTQRAKGRKPVWEETEIRIPAFPEQVDPNEWLGHIYDSRIKAVKPGIAEKRLPGVSPKRMDRPMIGSVSVLLARQRGLINVCRAPSKGALTNLCKALQGLEDAFDVILIDLPPQEGPLHTAAFQCNTDVENNNLANRLRNAGSGPTMRIICPTTTEFLAVHGISHARAGVQYYNTGGYGCRLDLSAVVVNMDTIDGLNVVDSRRKAKKWVEELNLKFVSLPCDLPLYDGWRGIPSSTHLQATQESMPIFHKGANKALKGRVLQIMNELAADCEVEGFVARRRTAA